MCTIRCNIKELGSWAMHPIILCLVPFPDCMSINRLVCKMETVRFLYGERTQFIYELQSSKRYYIRN